MATALMIRFLFFLLTFLSLPTFANAHDGKASYIANEGVMVTHTDANEGDIKILFDPLPLSGIGTYMDTPEEVKAALLSGAPPFDNVNVVFISHAHRDHFSAADMIAFMKAQPQSHLAAPAQALYMMMADPAWDAALEARMTILDMGYGEDPQSFEIGKVKASAVRIAHAGWPAPRHGSKYGFSCHAW